MNITPRQVTVAELFDGFTDSAEDGVVGYGGALDIRPAYQREFVYSAEQQEAVIQSALAGLPLNVFYWCVTPTGFEVLDGQQRTMSLCRYLDGAFSVKCDDGFSRTFQNLPSDLQARLKSYELMTYICDGTDSERLAWFRTINVAGERLTDQELRNAVYAGPWVTSAKRYFAKTGCPAGAIAADYLKGSPIRQDYLETAISWAAAAEGQSIDEHMSAHQSDPDAQPLWSHFRAVIDWVQAKFPHLRKKEMRGLPWGLFYNEHHDRTDLDPADLESRISALMADPDVTNKRGAYEYVLTGSERCLSIRAFDARMRRGAYERQGGVCPRCGERFEIEQMQADHIVPWSQGGTTTADNCQMLCARCNRAKSDD